MHPTLRRLVACLALPVTMAACTTWRPIEPGPQLISTVNSEERVRVRLDRVTLEGDELVLYDPRMDESALTGMPARRCEPPACRPVTFSRPEVVEIATASPNWLGTAVFLTGAVFVLGALLLAAACASSDQPDSLIC